MRVFNAFNGTEMKKSILADVARVLEQDTELMPHLTFPKVSYKVTIDMDIYPRTPAEKQIVAEGDITQVDDKAVPLAHQGDAHIHETLTSERSIDMPDATREELGIVTPVAAPQIQFARRAEVGKGSESPTIATGNRDR